MVCLGGCATSQKVDSSTVGKNEGFIQDGKTTKQQVQDRLGPAWYIYENGQILIYFVYRKDDGRLSLSGFEPCLAFVMVFDKENVLERHSLVRNGCR